jgi:hypothetical protein
MDIQRNVQLTSVAAVVVVADVTVGVIHDVEIVMMMIAVMMMIVVATMA